MFKYGDKMKKIFLTLLTTLFVSLSVFADNKQDATAFFDSYVNAANNYSNSVGDMYSPNAKIIRQVVKPDGTTVDVATDTSTYIKQMRLGQAGAKIRQYKNNYSNIVTTQIDEDTFKVSSLRQPSGENYKLKTYMIVQKQPSGKWLIIEEMMQTKVQTFLRYAKN